MYRRVAVTGIGIVSPVGIGATQAFDSLMAGRSGVRRLSAEFAGQLAAPIAGEVDLPSPPHPVLAGRVALDRFAALALIAAHEALGQAGLVPSSAMLHGTGVYLGTGMGGAGTLEEGYRELFLRGKDRLKPLTLPSVMNNAATAQVSLAWSMTGPSLTFSCACASSAVALGEAFRAIRHGYADAILAGGSEALLTYGTLKAWESLRTLAIPDPADPATSCRPFARSRTGLVLGEGAAMLMLEEWERAHHRGATVLAELVGYGTTSDASHLTRPSVDGQWRAMSTALADARLAPDEIGYINAHGTATLAGDKVETDAIKQAFGAHARQVAVSSTKSMHGHLMGAAGAMELAVAVLSLVHQAIPPTAHLHDPDPECDLDYVALEGRTGVRLRCAMSNSFAFGGTNAVLVARAQD
jgi:3-oxoacyl-[acyl-carrier-protein] synthase II